MLWEKGHHWKQLECCLWGSQHLAFDIGGQKGEGQKCSAES